MTSTRSEERPPAKDQVRLKGHVSISRTLNLGNFNSIKVELSEEYDQAETTFEEVFDDLMKRLDSELTKKRIVKQ
jgi:hypothetical protein